MNYKIWRSYYSLEQYNDFNLLTNDNVIPYNTNDLSNTSNNINYLNEYLGELVMFYYIWKNNIKSDIIFIDQFAKRFYQNAYEDGIELLNYMCSIMHEKKRNILDILYKELGKDYLIINLEKTLNIENSVD